MKMLISITVLAVASPALAQTAHPVRGYVRQDGTYVAPHYQTNPNGTRLDNYSTRGNVNPYTGKPGTVDPYAPPQQEPPFGYTPPTDEEEAPQ